MRVLAGRYRLMRQVGRGGSAVVWQAVDQLLDRTVAVKLLVRQGSEDRRWREAVRSEARAAARLNHPNVAAVYDYGETRLSALRRMPFLVLEYVDGETLGDLMRRTGALGWPDAGRICAEVAAGVAAVHDAGLVHRDVKPGNVLLAPGGPKLVDLGVALAVGAASVNRRGEIRGTPSYMAPEQLRGERAVPACDVYALGLLLTECLTGRPPARPEGFERDDHRAPGIDGVPEEVEELRRRCLAPVPAERPAARTVARLLAAAAATDPVRLRPATIVRVNRGPTITATSRSGRSSGGRRAALIGGLPVVLAAAVLAAQLPGSGSARNADGTPDARTPPFACTVTYSSERANGSFGAELSVEVTGTHPTGRPVLSFRLAPGQRLAAPLDRWQSGRLVRLPVPLRSSRLTRVPLDGTYTARARTAPDGFALAGVSCRRSSALVTIADDGAPGTVATTADGPRSPAGKPAPTRSAGPAAGQETAATDGPADKDLANPPVPAGPPTDAATPSAPATTVSHPTASPTGSAGPTPSQPESPSATPSKAGEPTPTPPATPSKAEDPTPNPEPTGASASTGTDLPA